MTDDEHHARAALMGMKYHNDNGGDCPFYYELGTDGIPMASSFIDADTLEPFFVSGPTVHDEISYHATMPKVKRGMGRESFWPPIK